MIKEEIVLKDNRSVNMIKEVEINSLEELIKELLKVPKDYNCTTALGYDCCGIVNHLTIDSERKEVVIWGNY